MLKMIPLFILRFFVFIFTTGALFVAVNQSVLILGIPDKTTFNTRHFKAHNYLALLQAEAKQASIGFKNQSANAFEKLERFRLPTADYR